jgi:hypothetical protein
VTWSGDASEARLSANSGSPDARKSRSGLKAVRCLMGSVFPKHPAQSDGGDEHEARMNNTMPGSVRGKKVARKRGRPSLPAAARSRPTRGLVPGKGGIRKDEPDRVSRAARRPAHDACVVRVTVGTSSNGCCRRCVVVFGWGPRCSGFPSLSPCPRREPRHVVSAQRGKMRRLARVGALPVGRADADGQLEQGVEAEPAARGDSRPRPPRRG